MSGIASIDTAWKTARAVLPGYDMQQFLCGGLASLFMVLSATSTQTATRNINLQISSADFPQSPTRIGTPDPNALPSYATSVSKGGVSGPSKSHSGRFRPPSRRTDWAPPDILHGNREICQVVICHAVQDFDEYPVKANTAITR